MAGNKARESSSRRDLAQQITLAESTRSIDRQKTLERLVDYDDVGSNTIRIGISGIPGVGKSSFIESFGLYLVRAQQRRLAVLTVDPSSPVRGGSLLGDKTRMQDLSREPNAFIRAAPASGHLGGVTRATRECLYLCEMAGYDTVMIETVGVGQSEHDVARLVDVFILLLQPGAGDTLQGIKRGILELVDVVVVNKNDGDNREQAQATAASYRKAFELSRPELAQNVFLCSSLESDCMDEIYQSVEQYCAAAMKSGAFRERRRRQNAYWLEVVLQQLVMDRLASDDKLEGLRDGLRAQVASGELSVYRAAFSMLEAFLPARK